jgi:hypothetical protein
MNDVVADTRLIAYCGLYCGACGARLKGRCPGCAGNSKATWCSVRACCLERKIASCAECADYPDPRGCRKFHNVFSRVVGFLLRSDRRACVLRLREVGPDAYAREMTSRRARTLRP